MVHLQGLFGGFGDADGVAETGAAVGFGEGAVRLISLFSSVRFERVAVDGDGAGWLEFGNDTVALFRVVIGSSISSCRLSLFME